MVSIQKISIKGKEYSYLVKSLRLPDGKTASINKILKKNEENLKPKKLEKKYKEYFISKEQDLSAEWAVKHYKKSYIFTNEEIKKVEKMKVGYKYLIKKLDKLRIQDIFDRFTVNFTYDSNAIEGNSLTLKDVAVVLLEKENIQGRSLREMYETINSRTVVDMMLKRRFSITINDIIKVHKMLMKDIDTRTGFKKIPNVIYKEERQVETTPPELVESKIKSLIKWYEKEIKNRHPLEIAALFHGMFEEIHPFEDGNGRTGRVLINAILVNNRYPPLIIRKTSRKAYMNALLAFDYGHKDKLLRFMLEKSKETYRKFFEIYVNYV